MKSDAGTRLRRLWARLKAVLPGRRRPGHRGGIEELYDHAPILPVLCRQLGEASQDMESEVANVCGRFHGMASKARETVASAAGLLGHGNEETDVTEVIGDCRDTMLRLLDRMEKSSELSARTIAQMGRVQTSVKQVGKVLEQVDQVALSGKIVALNAKIEAVHLGEAGRGFEVVAEEISRQAAQSTQLTADVGAILEALLSDAREAASDLELMSSADRQWMQRSREEINGVLAALERTSHEMRATLAAASDGSRELAGDIEAALVNLQFQDRVNQRIQHVVESLESMYGAISGYSGTEGEPARERQRQIAEKLTSSYTMQAEREAHLKSGDDGSARDREPDVELF